MYVTKRLILHLFAILSRLVHNRYIYFGYLFVLCVKPIPNLGELKAKSNKRHNKNKVGIGLIRYNDANVSGYFNNK